MKWTAAALTPWASPTATPKATVRALGPEGLGPRGLPRLVGLGPWLSGAS